MKRLREIETLFAEGFELNQANDMIGCCDKWLEAWDKIKELFAEGVAEDIHDLNNKYKWKYQPVNFVQFLEMELHNAGIDDCAYHQKRVEFCKELLQWCGGNELLINNTRIALGTAHYWSGDETSGEEVFKEWIREDPDCGWAYSGWAECYSFRKGDSQYDRAEEILLSGYAREGLRDRIYVAEGLMRLYEETGDADKAAEFEKICSELQPGAPYPDEPEIIDTQKSEPVRVVKVGRNEPCPCGSGKKYKKCCLP
jgi:tetratricopeptide (TPR) repeat protein